MQSVGVCMCGICNVWVCVCLDLVTCSVYVWFCIVCVCVCGGGFVTYECVYVRVLYYVGVGMCRFVTCECVCVGILLLG